MKIWQTFVLVVVVITTGFASVFYTQSKADDVEARVQEMFAAHEKAVGMRLQALKTSLDENSQAMIEALANSASATTSDTSKAFDTRLKELNTSMTDKIETASSETSADVARRLDAIEKSLDAKITALESLIRVRLGSGDIDLSGKWERVLPSGDKRQSSIVQLPDGRYRLVRCGVFGGIYELKNDLLTVVEPVDKRLTEFVWKVQDADNPLLIQSSTKTGQDYTGATLKRIQ